MSVLSFKEGNFRTLDSMHSYIENEEKTAEDDLFGLGINPRFALEEMEFAKQVYQQTNGTAYKQIVFSFDQDIQLTQNEIKKVVERIGFIFAEQYQVFVGIHHNTNNLHAHYMVNTVNVDTGNRYRQEFSVNHYKREVNKIIAEYDLNPIKIRKHEDCSNNMQNIA